MGIIERFSLEGKVAVVTGGAGGIGQVYGRALADAGAAVVLADLEVEQAEQAADKLGSDGGVAIGLRVDITDPESAQAMATQTVERFGGIDILVNNAALMKEIPRTSLAALPLEWFERVVRVNVMGALVCTQAVLPSMLSRGGGRIINQVSAGAFMPGGGLYGMSKLALVSLTASLATELGPQGINVNAIAPGLVQDDAGFASLAEQDPLRLALAAAIPGKKQAPPEDLTGALLLLASPAGDWINGQTLSVDGGWIMRV
jgi:NAD(P)-dependent dehydrogenase (short-subunit alcohol dehydrogenase family)